MIDFRQLDGPSGIPVFFQHLPVNTVSVYWMVFVGSADDELAGGQGIYHWFEHIPSRGTAKYPGGYRDTEARLVRHGGTAGAETGCSYTSYYAHVPKRSWREALDILTDMIAQPLLRPEDIEAEREVIRQEIDEWHSAPYQESQCLLPGLIWPGHPMGHDQLGTRASLDAIQPAQIRRAHQLGYSRSRSALLVAGGIDAADLLDEVARCVERFPDRPLGERRRAASYGPLPAWPAGQMTTVPTEHDDAVMYLLLPIPPYAQAPEQLVTIDMLEYVLTAGDLGSPLNQVVREESLLAYSPEFVSSVHPDGGYWGLAVQTSGRQPEEVFETFWRLLHGELLRSADWYDFVRDTVEGQFAMQGPRPEEFTESGSEHLLLHGRPWSDDEFRYRLLSVSRQELSDYLDSLSPDKAHAIVFAPRE